MLTIHPQFITDSNGEKSLDVLPVQEFDKIMEELQDVEDVRLFDQARSNDDGSRIPMSEAFQIIEAKRNQH